MSDGIIRRKLKSGDISFLVRIKDSQGKYYPSETFDNFKDAAARKDELRVNRRKGAKVLSQGRYTLKEYWDKWNIERGIEWGLRHRNDTESRFRNYIEPILGSKKITEINNVDISRLMLDLKNKGLSASTRNHIQANLNAMFRDAVEFYNLLISSPVRKDHRAKTSKIERPFWRPNECYLFLDSVREHPYGVAFWIMTWNGFRIGEMLGLRHGDIDLEAEVFHIKRQWSKNEYKIKERKNLTEYSPKMAPALADFLREKIPKNADPNSLVITNRLGGIACYKTVSNGLTKACKAVGLKRLTPHELRHSMTGLWGLVGAGESDIRDLLGQKSTVSAKGYIHQTTDRMELLAERLRASRQQNVISITSKISNRG